MRRQQFDIPANLPILVRRCLVLFLQKITPPPPLPPQPPAFFLDCCNCCYCCCALVSVTGNAGIGMPIILLHDAEGGIITVELKNGEVCRGVLDEAEDSMNLVLKVR